jgi:competence protein ComEA
VSFSTWEKATGLVLLIAASVGFGAVLGVRISRPRVKHERFFSEAPGAAQLQPRVVVHIAGLVRNPGLYRLKPGTRVGEALRMAGGPLPQADPDSLNLAEPVADGQKIEVLARGQLPPELPTSAAQPAARARVAHPARSGKPSLPPSGKINLNAATAQQLEALPGIGPALAKRIIQLRNQLKHQNGHGFQTVEQLLEVPGIGPKRFADIRDRVTL